MDWSTYVASVPGLLFNDSSYKTPALKRTGLTPRDPGVERIKTSFATWCGGHDGKVLFVTQFPDGGLGHAFFFAANAWANENIGRPATIHYSVTPLICFDNRTKDVIAAIVLRSDLPIAGADSLQEVFVGFYTPSQASAFADFYNSKAKESSQALQQQSQERAARRDQETQRLRIAPKIGDQTDVGLVVDLRPPLVQLQYDERVRRAFGKPQLEWVPIASLNAPN